LNGDAVARTTGKSSARQFLEQWKLAVSLRIAPTSYYAYELHRPDHFKAAAQYLMRHETREIAYRLLCPLRTDHTVPSPLKDRVAFTRHCSKYHLKHVPTLLKFEQGRPFNTELPESDLFVKPVTGKSGAGAESWKHVAPGRYSDGRGRELNSDQLLLHIQDLSRFVEPYMVQAGLHQHATLADLGGGALCTVRMLTCRNEDGGHELTDAVFRMPVGSRSEADIFPAGGITSAVDIRSGTLGPATDLGTTGGSVWHKRHPDTRATIVGRRLPMWREAVALVERAHRVFGDHAIIGWDIAFLNDGPVLIEGDGSPDIDIHQRAGRRAMGDGRFGALLAYNLESLFTQAAAL